MPGAGPWHQPVRTLGVAAVLHLNNANGTDAANSLTHAWKDHPQESPSQSAEAERWVASRLALGMAGGRLAVDHLALAVWRHLFDTPSALMQRFKYCLGTPYGW